MITLRSLAISLLVFCNCSAIAGSKVIGTGGATTIEGSAGGGIVPWAVINGYASSGQWSVTGFGNQVGVDDFSLRTIGAGFSYGNQLEVSLTKQTLALETIGGDLKQTIVGVKYHVAGELLYTEMPQISVGAQWKKHQNFELPQAVGALDDQGIDWYVAASKVWLDAFAGRNLLLNATVRATKANQTGLLGFGSAEDNSYQLMTELSATIMLTPHWAVGAEFRQKPNQLAFADEEHWRDVFTAWFINKNVSLVGGYVDLGSIAGLPNQQGYYVAVEATW
ncbi:MAG: DUF3034 family protein [Gammaproteobacteria bacterium]|nr:DUF3034 family protein [Gammaproteobacteria bacterium]